MVRDTRPGADPGPSLQPVLDALDDSDCRTIIERLDEPLTAGEVSEECDIPMSTTYRKLDLLSDAQLLAEGVEVRQDGHHATRYRTDFEDVIVTLTEQREFDVSINRPAEDAADRLASMWSEVRTEADR
ncbi:winged helix-turn-helix domain-containing protein [Halobaculum limi]|uniref:winged helix-turn-helix domain-containing protein n=1 Tax=Halobaculum limi TaxID=3031916 RepID=UPI002406C3E5|nr:helix-turn-helix domain-containing protein [Halobaculum sp. YSMS11]